MLPVDLKTSELRLSAERFRRPSAQEVQRLRTQIELHGFIVPLVVQRETMQVVAGNARLELAREMGLETVPCVLVQLDERQATALALALNKISGAWHKERLSALLAELVETVGDVVDVAEFSGFSEGEIAALLSQDFTHDAPEVEIVIGEYVLTVPAQTFAPWWAAQADLSGRNKPKEVAEWIADQMITKIVSPT